MDPFLQRYVVAPHLHPERIDDERVLLVGEVDNYLLQGRTMSAVVALLDGRRTVSELAEATQITVMEVFHAVSTLADAGHVVPVEALESPAPEFWTALGIEPARASAALATTGVRVTALGELDAEPLQRALLDAGVRVREDGPLQVVMCSDLLDLELERWHRHCSSNGLSWIPVVPVGIRPTIGPIFTAGEGPCWQCLAHRIRWNRPVEGYLGHVRGHAGPYRVTRPSPASALLFGLAALLVTRQIVDDYAGPLANTLHVVDALASSTERHPVAQRPQCPSCGEPGWMQRQLSRPIVIDARSRAVTRDGGYRVCTPQQTIDRIRPLVSPITGVVASVGPVPERNHELRPVYAAMYRVCPRDRVPSFEDFHQASFGKGRQPVQAKASALCEAVERISAIWHGDEAIVNARIDEVEGAVHPDALQNFSVRQYAERERINATVKDPRQRIPEPFDPELAIDWTPAFVLKTGELRHLPASYCYSWRPGDLRSRACQFNPNGHSAGNCRAEAILQGLLELAERDAVALWWYGRHARPGVDLAEVGGPWAERVKHHYDSIGFDVWSLDLSSDLGIPTFASMARRRSDGQMCVAGFGAHLDAGIALHRSLSELNQIFDPARLLAPWGDKQPDDTGYLVPAELAPVSHAARPGDADIGDDIEWCVERLAALGIETMVIDQTRPDFGGICCVKVIAPGLRHFWPRLAPGRLYDVPVQLGWRADPVDERALNPVPMYL